LWNQLQQRWKTQKKAGHEIVPDLLYVV
jgi:hypothetical protein